MEYIGYKISCNQEIFELYCEFQKEENFFKRMNYEQFAKHLLNNEQFQKEGAFVALKDGKVVGFAGAIVREVDNDNPNASGYIHTFIVKKECRRQGIGSNLLQLCEDYIKKSGRTSSRLVFISPINWTWYIPHTNCHEHPGAPGIRINSDMYLFLYHHGYSISSIHEGFHLPLAQYELPKALVERMKENEAKGLTIEIYNPEKHFGIEDFCIKINNAGFAGSIRKNLAKEKPDPFLVASENGKVVGWTGAMYNEPSGRGHFDGICVDPDVRGGGLGKSLFAMLCYESKKNGAQYMTFFTGLENPARYIYLSAGFKIGQSFADMKKPL